jgi:outer membrane biogenesis lipoprotein LolB
MKIVLLLVSLMLTSCGVTYSRPNVTNAEATRDDQECVKEADHRKCMEQRGYTRRIIWGAL